MPSLTVSDLHALLYSHPDYEGATPLSLHPNDSVTLHKIRLVPIHIGLAIQEADPTSRLFHVEFFPLAKRAEVWSRHAWDHSFTRILRQKDQQAVLISSELKQYISSDPVAQLAMDLAKVEAAIVLRLASNIQTSRTQAESVAKAVVRAAFDDASYQTLIAIINPPEELKSAIDDMRRRYTALSKTVPSTHPLYEFLSSSISLVPDDQIKLSPSEIIRQHIINTHATNKEDQYGK